MKKKLSVKALMEEHKRLLETTKQGAWAIYWMLEMFIEGKER